MLGSVTDGEHAGPVQAFVSGNGELLGWRRGEQLSLAPRHLMDTLYALHVNLMLDEVGAWFLGLVALAWILDHIAAAVLAVPRVARWREAFTVQGRRGSLRRLFDLHRAPGLWSLPFTLVLAVSGFCLSWHEESRAIVGVVSPVSHRLHEDFSVVEPARKIPLSTALYNAQLNGAGRIDSVLILERNGAYGVRSFDARDIDPYGRLWTYIAMDDGRLLGQRHDNGESAGDAFFAWQYPLHSGKAFGLPGRLAIFGAGLATLTLCITGVRLWWRRRWQQLQAPA